MITKLGIEFTHNGDDIIWLWPWKRTDDRKYISLGFTGTGQFGDAKFKTLEEIDAQWEDYFRVSSSLPTEEP